MKLDELQRLAEGADVMPWERPRDVPYAAKAEFRDAMSPDTAKKLIAVALEGLALVDDFDCHSEPKQSHPRYIERLRTALEELKHGT